MQKPSAVIPVTASVDDDGLVHIEGDDVSLVRWNHRPAVLRDALHRFGGMAVWKPRWYILAVPTEAFLGGARTVFSLAALDQRRECFFHRAQLISLARERGLYPPENGTDEELKRVEWRLNAERGWIADPPPPTEWHTPGWVKTGGRHFVTYREPSREMPDPPLRLARRYADGRPRK